MRAGTKFPSREVSFQSVTWLPATTRTPACTLDRNTKNLGPISIQKPSFWVQWFSLQRWNGSDMTDLYNGNLNTCKRVSLYWDGPSSFISMSEMLPMTRCSTSSPVFTIDIWKQGSFQTHDLKKWFCKHGQRDKNYPKLLLMGVGGHHLIDLCVICTYLVCQRKRHISHWLMIIWGKILHMLHLLSLAETLLTIIFTEKKVLSFWQIFIYGFIKTRLSKKLPVHAVIKISSKWHFFPEKNYDRIKAPFLTAWVFLWQRKATCSVVSLSQQKLILSYLMNKSTGIFLLYYILIFIWKRIS